MFAYEKPATFAFCASVLDLVTFVRFTLYKTKTVDSRPKCSLILTALLTTLSKY
ncbi:hypothetical protein Hanom_Chr07g00634811 [Helianthus anomalus]